MSEPIGKTVTTANQRKGIHRGGGGEMNSEERFTALLSNLGFEYVPPALPEDDVPIQYTLTTTNKSIDIPENTTELIIERNTVDTLKNITIPESVTKIIINPDNNLDRIADTTLSDLGVLPYGLKELKLFNCTQITTLPSLESLTSLTSLTCIGCPNIILPELPPNIEILDVRKNNLETLPKLPTSLKTLICTYNSLTALPKLPTSLEELFCDYNRLSELPELHEGLKIVIASNTDVTIIPMLPNSITSVGFDQTNLLECFKLAYDTYIESGYQGMTVLRTQVNKCHEELEKVKNKTPAMGGSRRTRKKTHARRSRKKTRSVINKRKGKNSLK